MADRSAGAALAVLLAWAWGLWVPSQPMPAEVAAMLGYLLGPLVEDIRGIRRAIAGRLVARLAGDQRAGDSRGADHAAD